ncbi:hypothetical protein [Spiroplasma endosymbiont of Polydrusus pterygomalis]|uniref:TMEM164 family acyltransferase n=1 Tax=Spiroplasma endosymbiont of Polydrusus pterygomalis TaxID=3139327 RepID=UPI003CCB0EF8
MHIVTLGFFDGNPQTVINPLFGMYYWIGLTISFILIISLFIFKKFYVNLSKSYLFKWNLGIFQLFLYISFYVVHGLSGDNYYWYDYFPFQLCSVLNLTSSILLMIPNKSLFNMTFPLIGPVILAFLLPDKAKWVFGPQHFLYWNYYLIHIIIMFSYLLLYLYGHIEYEKIYIKKSILYLTLFGAGVFIFNTSFGTNYLFIGSAGYTAGFGKKVLDTSVWLPIFRFIFMSTVGISLLGLTYIFIIKTFVPFYIEKGTKINPIYENKKTLITKFSSKFKFWRKKGKKMLINS